MDQDETHNLGCALGRRCVEFYYGGKYIGTVVAIYIATVSSLSTMGMDVAYVLYCTCAFITVNVYECVLVCT